VPGAIATNTGRGLLFRNGYFEANIGWDYTDGTVRTWWMNYVTGTSIEIDMMEYFGSPVSAIHEWATPGGTSPDMNAGGTNFGGPQSAVVRNSSPGQIAYNKFGFLWTPNILQIFINDQPGQQVNANQTFGWYPFGQNPGNNVATGTINVFGGANRGGMLVQMGIWNGSAPQLCNMFRIWQ